MKNLLLGTALLLMLILPLVLTQPDDTTGSRIGRKTQKGHPMTKNPNTANHRPDEPSIVNPPPLTPEEKRVILHKGTERPFSGQYHDHWEPGTYHCRQCGAALFPADAKFRSDCGWPSFDQAIPQGVKRIPDADGIRTEIVCAACKGHLGHVFKGEGFTPRNTRYCVNSVSMSFAPHSRTNNAATAPSADSPSETTHKANSQSQDNSPPQPQPQASDTQRALFAAGCFWGVEQSFRSLKGVVDTTVGYSGGSATNPTYEWVCTGGTGHAETVEVMFDPGVISYQRLLDHFFQLHRDR